MVRKYENVVVVGKYENVVVVAKYKKGLERTTSWSATSETMQS